MGDSAVLAADAAAVLSRWNPAGAAASSSITATVSAGEVALRRIREHAEVVRAAPDLTTLRAERVRIVGRRDGGRAEAVALLRGQVQLARVDLAGEVGARMRTLQKAARDDLDRLEAASLRECPARLTAAVVEVTNEIDAVAVARFERIALTTIGAPLRTPPQPPDVDLGDGPQPRQRTIEDRLMILLGASAGVGLGRLAVAPFALVPALDIATIPLTLVLGGLASWWIARSRGRLADRAHLRQWVADTLVHLKAQLEQWTSAGLVATESELTERIVRVASTRTAAVDAEIARLETELRQGGARNASRLAACERDREALTRGLAALSVQQGTESESGASK